MRYWPRFRMWEASTSVSRRRDLRFAVIMSGGSGRRFWPLSRAAKAKQMIRLVGGKTLLELTVERLLPLFPPENIFVVTQKRQYTETSHVLKRFGAVRILSEPVGRNTAACIAYAAAYIDSTVGDAVLAFLPADHFIEFEDRFRTVLTAGMDFVEESGRHLTLGIKPDRPATGFGYIRRGSRVAVHGDLDFFKVSEFAESACISGGLGRLPAKQIMLLAMANALKLNKFGA